MKILILYQYFNTPKGGWSTRIYGLAKNWVDQGNEVTVLTTLYDKSDLKAEKFITKMNIDGINVILMNIKLSNKHSFIKRIYSFFAFGIISSYYTLRLNFDVCVSSSGPLTVGFPGYISKIFRPSRKFIFELRDLWPTGAIELGIIKSKTLIYISKYFERLFYRKADLIVTASVDQKKHVQNVVRNKDIKVFSNASDNDLVEIINSVPQNLTSYFESFNVVVYAGTLGLIDDCSQILNAAQELKNRGREDILIMIVGDGAQRKYLELERLDLNLDNVVFTGLQSKLETLAILKKAIASIFTVLDRPFLNSASPNKVFDSFSTSTPVINTTSGYLANVIRENNCGINVQINDKISLANAIIQLTDNKEKQEELSANSLKVAKNIFDRKKIAMDYLSAMEDLIAK